MPVRHFLEHVDASGLQYRWRWNDLIVQSAAVQMHLPRAKLHLFTDFSYEHATRGDSAAANRTDCVLFGGYAQGTRDAEGWSRGLRFLGEMCAAPCWRVHVTPLAMRGVGVETSTVAVTAGSVVVEQPDCAWPASAGRCAREREQRTAAVCQMPKPSRELQAGRCNTVLRWIQAHPARQNLRSGVRFGCAASLQAHLHECRSECPRPAVPSEGDSGLVCTERLVRSDKAAMAKQAAPGMTTSVPWAARGGDVTRPSGFSRRDARRHGCEDLTPALAELSRMSMPK